MILCGLFYKNIKAIYNSVSYQVKIHNGILDPILSSLGLKQGGILSSTLFNIYVDDMKDIFDETCDPITVLGTPLSHLLFADDLLLMSLTEAGLNSCLEN